MRNKISSSRFVLMFVLILALAAFPASVSANHSWGNYHWARTINPFTLKLGDNVTSAWDPTWLQRPVTGPNLLFLTQPLWLVPPPAEGADRQVDALKSAMPNMEIMAGLA